MTPADTPPDTPPPMQRAMLYQFCITAEVKYSTVQCVIDLHFYQFGATDFFNKAL